MTFPLEQDGRVIHAVAGSRTTSRKLSDVLQNVRQLVQKVDPLVFAPLPPEVDDDALLGPLLSACGPRIHVPRELAILPPSLRFNRHGKRVFAAMKWMNGVSGYVLSPSEFRSGLAIWAFSEGGMLRHEEYATPVEWLLELVAGLEAAPAGEDPQALWSTIKGDLPKPEPAPRWEPPVQNGLWERTSDGVVDRAVTYRDGKREGVMRWWNVEEFPINGDAADPDSEFGFRQGAVIREGSFVADEAHGFFRFSTPQGKPTYEVEFERGFPTGVCTVFPEATRGLFEPATIRYEAGVPVSWSIPPYAATSAKVDRAGAPSASLTEISQGEPLVLINCLAGADHPLKEADERELEGVVVIGVGERPGRAALGRRKLEIVADPRGELVRAYGHENTHLAAMTLIRANGGLAGAGRLSSLRAVKAKLGMRK